MSGPIVETNKTVSEVPWSMQKLAKMVARSFYGIEHLLVMEQLIRNTCMREDEIRDIIKFEPKMLRSVLMALKCDKLIVEKQEVVEVPGARAIRNNYYFINYHTLINVLKYKIDHIRKKLNAEEMQQAHSALYKCTKCSKTYSDLDVGLLWNGMEMQCSFCNGAVEEDPSALPATTKKSLIAQFNEQIFPFLQKLHEVEDVKLAPFLLDPVPAPLQLDTPDTRGKHDGNPGSGSGAGDGMPTLGGRSSSNVRAGGGYNMLVSGSSEISVRIEGHDDLDTQKGVAVKEVPAWLRDATATSSSAGGQQQQRRVSGEVDEANILGRSPPGPRSSEIMETLLTHEKPALLSPRSDDSGPSSLLLHGHSASQEDEDFEDVEHKVTVGGTEYTLEQLSERPDLIAGMTGAEKAEFERASQAAYEHFYD